MCFFFVSRFVCGTPVHISQNTFIPWNILWETLHYVTALNPRLFVYSAICDMFRPVSEIIHIRLWELLLTVHICTLLL